MPGMRTEPSGRVSTFSPERMNSSSISPTISPSRRSSVTSPTNLPYSSRTKASLALSSRKRAISISTVCISITHGTCLSMERRGGRIPFFRISGYHIFNMQHANDRFTVPFIHGNMGMRPICDHIQNIFLCGIHIQANKLKTGES